ncbi:MAG: Tripartite tricarboxylate transporter TctB family protein [Spirochaetes bacterium ADurb.Bin110]|nr:MAG: Tripartite tricarboxylate transporter TctB family protein [Spirochaetes bacterium ADurb.Bin110]
MKIAIKRDQFVGIFLIVVGVIYGYMTSKIDFAMTAEYPGPKAFPYILTFTVGILKTAYNPLCYHK